MTSSRYAIYFVPTNDSKLGRFGSNWLGRDVWRGHDLTPQLPRGMSFEDHAQITSSPRHYGFHGTLKPPFRLSDGFNEDELLDAVRIFTRAHEAFGLPRLKLTRLDSFLALCLVNACPQLDQLAAEAVEVFDIFRAPSSDADLAKRRKAGLTARQENYLQQWGYPYVIDEFRFHLTLTGRLDNSVIDQLMDDLAPDADLACAAAPTMEALTVCYQPDRDTPFTALKRFELGTI